MEKLSQKNVNNIIQRYKRGENVSRLASSYGVSRQRIYQIITSYKEFGSPPALRKPGRKQSPISKSEIDMILECYSESKLGAELLERYIENTRKIHIPHNRIHKVLINENLASESPKKKKQRKYCRYQRNHSMTLWHTDWKECKINNERMFFTAYIDDRSRMITCYGIFDAQTTENSLIVLKQGIAAYGCPEQIVTDNGTQYVAARSDDPFRHVFRKFLLENGIKHIRARVSHPQTNGKIERFFGEIERRIKEFGSVEAMVDWQNKMKPHKGIGYEIPEEVFWHALKPERIMEYVKDWFWENAGGS